MFRLEVHGGSSGFSNRSPQAACVNSAPLLEGHSAAWWGLHMHRTSCSDGLCPAIEGLVPCALFIASGHDVALAQAKAMMQALRCQKIPAPGGVLRLKNGARFVPHKLSGVYIRDCYKELANAILTSQEAIFIRESSGWTG